MQVGTMLNRVQQLSLVCTMTREKIIHAVKDIDDSKAQFKMGTMLYSLIRVGLTLVKTS